MLNQTSMRGRGRGQAPFLQKGMQMNMQDAPSYPPTKGTARTGTSPVPTYMNTGNTNGGLLKALNGTGLRHGSCGVATGDYNRRVRFAICLLLVGAAYLLFQIAGGFPPWAWRFLFDVLPRLPDLWAAQGFGVLLPLIGLLLLSLSLLILWGLIIFGIS